jgi:hypothetical protein
MIFPPLFGVDLYVLTPLIAVLCCESKVSMTKIQSTACMYFLFALLIIINYQKVMFADSRRVYGDKRSFRWPGGRVVAGVVRRYPERAPIGASDVSPPHSGNCLAERGGQSAGFEAKILV